MSGYCFRVHDNMFTRQDVYSRKVVAVLILSSWAVIFFYFGSRHKQFSSYTSVYNFMSATTQHMWNLNWILMFLCAIAAANSHQRSSTVLFPTENFVYGLLTHLVRKSIWIIVRTVEKQSWIGFQDAFHYIIRINVIFSAPSAAANSISWWKDMIWRIIPAIRINNLSSDMTRELLFSNIKTDRIKVVIRQMNYCSYSRHAQLSTHKISNKRYAVFDLLGISDCLGLN